MSTDQDTTRLSRLTAILTILLSRRLVTATALAQRFGVSIRTIYRDIRALESAGVPVVTEEGRGYTLVEGYKLPPVMFTEEEAIALITSEQIILRGKDRSFKEAFQRAIGKIRAVLNEGSQARTELLTDRMFIGKNTQGEESSNNLIPLQMALTKHQLVRIDYLDRTGSTSQRLVEPFALYHSAEENWTLVAFCRLRQDFRSFRLDRIQSLQPCAEHFSPHKLTMEQYVEKYQRRRDP